jgi:hypothetical protein
MCVLLFLECRRRLRQLLDLAFDGRAAWSGEDLAYERNGPEASTI